MLVALPLPAWAQPSWQPVPPDGEVPVQGQPASPLWQPAEPSGPAPAGTLVWQPEPNSPDTPGAPVWEPLPPGAELPIPANAEPGTPAFSRPSNAAEAEALLNSLWPQPSDYLPLLQLGAGFPTARVLASGEVEATAFELTPLRGGGDAGGTGNQNYVGRLSIGLTDQFQLNAFFAEADDPLYAQPAGKDPNPANFWQSYGLAAQWQLLNRSSWRLAFAGSLERFNVGSGGCGSGGRDGDSCTPNIFNNSGQRVYTENLVGSLALPLSWQASRQLELTLVPGASILPNSQGAGQGGSGTFFGTNVTLGAGLLWQASPQLQLLGSALLPLGPGTNSFNDQLQFSRVPIWSAGLNYALNPRIGLQASLTNGFGGSPATAILTLPSSNQPLVAARFSYSPGAVDSPELPFTPRSRSLSLGGLTVATALVPPSGTSQVWLNADSAGNVFGQLAYSLSNDFQLQVLSAGEFNQVTPVTDLVATYANDGSLNTRFGGKAVFLHQLRGAPFSLAGSVSLGQNRGSSFQGYLFADLAATWEANHWLAFNLNPKLAWSGVATPVGIGLGANLQLARNLQLIPELNWVTSSAGDSNAALALRWLPSATTAIDLYVSNAAGLLDMGQLLQTDQTRVGAKLTLQF